MKNKAVLDGLQTRDGFPLFVGAGISSRDHHHGSSCPRVNLELLSWQGALANRLQQFKQVGLDPGEHTFGFGIAHADIVFDYIGISDSVHQSDEYTTLIRGFLVY